MRGVAAAVGARPGFFAGAAAAAFLVHVLMPPVVLSLVRKPWDYFAFNAWLSKLPEYLASTEIALEKKIEFLPKLALFWFSANGPYGSPEWGFAVDVTDLARFLLVSLLLGAYFSLWLYRRDQVKQSGWGVKVSRSGGVVGAFGSVLGFSTGPCSVTGCGAPVLPVVGLAFAGLSSGTVTLLSELSKVSAVVILVGLTLGVAYFGWVVGTEPEGSRPSARIHPP